MTRGIRCLTDKHIRDIYSVFLCYAIVALRLCNVGVYDGRLHHNMTAGKVPASFKNPGYDRGFYMDDRISMTSIFPYSYLFLSVNPIKPMDGLVLSQP